MRGVKAKRLRRWAEAIRTTFRRADQTPPSVRRLRRQRRRLAESIRIEGRPLPRRRSHFEKSAAAIARGRAEKAERRRRMGELGLPERPWRSIESLRRATVLVAAMGSGLNHTAWRREGVRR